MPKVNLNDCSRNLCVPVAPWLRGHMFSRSERHPSGYAPENIYFETKRFDPVTRRIHSTWLSADAWRNEGRRPNRVVLLNGNHAGSRLVDHVDLGGQPGCAPRRPAERSAQINLEPRYSRNIPSSLSLPRWECSRKGSRSKPTKRHQLAKNSAMSLSKSIRALVLLATLVTVAVALAAFQMHDPRKPDQDTSRQVMLIFRGIANSENPRGQLDDDSALEYARRLGFEGEVLDVAGNVGATARKSPWPWSAFAATKR